MPRPELIRGHGRVLVRIRKLNLARIRAHDKARETGLFLYIGLATALDRGHDLVYGQNHDLCRVPGHSSRRGLEHFRFHDLERVI